MIETCQSIKTTCQLHIETKIPYFINRFKPKKLYGRIMMIKLKTSKDLWSYELVTMAIKLNAQCSFKQRSKTKN